MSKGFLEYADQHQGAMSPAPITATPPKLIPLDSIETDQARAVEICATYDRREQEARQTTEKIIKGIQDGAHPLQLLLLAAQCIDDLTGDTKVYSKVYHAAAGAYGAAMYGGDVLPEIRIEQLQKEIAGLDKARKNAEREISRRSRELKELQGQSLFNDEEPDELPL